MAEQNKGITQEVTDIVKNVLLAGIGGAALTVEKSQSILEQMVKKGELTVEQGKALNQELKHTVKESSDKVKSAAEEAREKATAPKDAEEQKTSLEDLVKNLSEEDKAKLKELLG